MPGYRKSKYTPQMNGQIKVDILDVLNQASMHDVPTLDYIKTHSPSLAGHTTQKLSRVLGELVDMGMVRKAKQKSTGRMVYRLTEKMIEDGYSIED